MLGGLCTYYSTTSNKMSSRPIHQYPESALAAALRSITENGRSIRSASKEFNVPRATLQDRIQGRILVGPRKMGPGTILTDEEESKLAKWCLNLAKCGFARKKDDLLNTVQKIINNDNRPNPFANGRPGKTWYASFLKRHPELAIRTAEGVSKGRAIITEENLRKWFRELNEYLKQNDWEDVLKDPSRIMNGDETSMSMCPKTGKVIAPKGWKSVYSVQMGKEKEAITVLLIFSADGKTVHPLVVFPYIRPPKDVVQSMPQNWILGRFLLWY